MEPITARPETVAKTLLGKTPSSWPSIPLKRCTVSEELVVKEAGKIVSKKKEKPLSFHIDVNNPKRYVRSQRSRLLRPHC